MPTLPLLRSVTVAVILGAAGFVSAVVPAAVAAAEEPSGTTVVGELVQAWAETDAAAHDTTAEASPAPVSWVETASGDVVSVASDDVTDVPAGSTVSLTVGTSTRDDAAPVLETEILEAPAAAPAPAGPLTNQVTVAMVAPAGTPSGPRATRQQIVDLVDGPVAQFWAEETGGAVSIGVTASHDWLTTTVGCANPAVLWNEVAAKVGFVAGPGKHLLLYIPPAAPGCAYALAEVGSSLTSGGRLYVRDAIPSVVAHEIGHNFGLAHSSGTQCDGTPDAGHCRTVGYRDYYDVMGASWDRIGSLNVVQAAYLGVLPATQVQHVPARGSAMTVTLTPVSGRTGVRALLLTDAAGGNYWLEYRPAAGRDAWLGTAADRFALDAGVLLRRTDRFPDTSILLDGTPSRAAGWDADRQAALPLGTSVPVAGGQFTIRVDAITADGAVVSVLPDPPALAPAAPPPPTEPAPGAVLPGGGVPAADSPAGNSATPPGPAPAVAAPDLAPISGPVGPEVASLAVASQPTGGVGSGVLLAGLGMALAGAMTLVVRTIRRHVRR